MENSLYCRFSTEQSLSQCHGLSLDDAQQCDCWHHHFSWLVYVQSVSFGLCQTKRGLCQCHQCRKPSSRSIWSFMLLPGRLLMTGTLYSTPLYSTPCWTVNYYPRIMEWSLHKFFNCVFTSYIYPLISVTFPFFVVCRLMMHSNVIVGINISRGSFIFSQFRLIHVPNQTRFVQVPPMYEAWQLKHLIFYAAPWLLLMNGTLLNYIALRTGRSIIIQKF